MWSVLHWIFLYCLNPNPCMHIISSFALSIMSAKTDDDFKKKDIVPAISRFLASQFSHSASIKANKKLDG